jgi:succinoglycan biosynthesis transport protein ExoP
LLAADPLAPAAPVGESRPLPARRPEDEPAIDHSPQNAESAAMRGDFAIAEGLAAHLLIGAEPGATLRTLIAGEGAGGSLSLALALARNFSSHGRAILVDLGPTQDWFADAFHRDPDAEGEQPGMAELLAGEASYAAVMQRDLSSELDVIPAGRGAASAEGLETVLAALAASYAFVLVHATDWRSEVALATMDHVDKAIVVAPASRLSASLAHAREAMGGAPGNVLGFVAANDSAATEKAA